jgi:hypothetical protein
MTAPATLTPLRALAFAIAAIAAVPMPAEAQQSFPGAGPGPGGRSQACLRLEAQLAAVDRGNVDPARADQVRRFEEAAGRQQAELDRLTAQARRQGCEGRGFFSLFGGQPAQCGPLNAQIQQMRANLDRILGDLQGMQANSPGREGQRRALLVALAQNDCGPQYRSAAVPQRDFFDSLFGPGTILSPSVPASDTYRTLCVRTCDGFYFPISYSTTPSKFGEDERVCQRMCPASEVVLYSHRNPGEDVPQAVSASGRNYTELPNAFAYRKQVNTACSCKAPGQTWADALKHLDDQTVERGDIVVTEDRAKQLSQPRVDAQGRPIRVDPRLNAAPKQGPAPAATEETPASPSGEPAKRQVRSVGPAFYPVR